ncbi:ResB protein required for cytochrome C biosynthesis [Cephaloticoccus primus]|uniref:ResB protein required for cytochrome C biosynthesis n=1 Tax=Cephaloticoccus primus TaxID=1548207 RepID=A0A139SPY9_9BACT|nr:cytochrome c biogenesis protein ResB [Cephaloticoccus primus]KXU36659.1 ResB protein required for cytochrome C biosynthesis [Cephaloticoccus primus]
MRDTWQDFIKFFTSLKLTVVLLALSIVLIFWATIAQVQLGIWGVQEQFFKTFFVLKKIPGTEIPVPVFPGGYFIGGLLLINLIAAHVYRFRFTWAKSGIQLTHAGLILLLLGELFTGLWQEDYQLRLDVGQAKNYSESFRDQELAITDKTDPDFDDVVVLPDKLLAHRGAVQHSTLPFRIVIRDYFPNAVPQSRDQVPANAGLPQATMGFGRDFTVIPLPLSYRQDQSNLAAALVELIGPGGSLGTWLLSAHPFVRPQPFEYDGRHFELSLRFARNYKPFSLTLLELRHDVYPGTDIPKNFSSRVRLSQPDAHADREVLIYMNNPLRYGGLTFYQYQMDSASGYSVLQVVRNPSWMLPYVSCILMMLGLLIQFGISLFRFTGKRRAAVGAANTATATPAATAA